MPQGFLMSSWIANLTKRLRRCRSGNAVMIVAMGMPLFIGAAGLAVDTAQWFLWKRELQHSVDQAAMAAAWALSNPDAETTYKTRALQEFDANQKLTAKFTSQPTVNIASFAGGSDNSVVVVATATKSLPFSYLLTGDAAVIRVKAQASFDEGQNYSACLIATTEEGTGLDIGGNANVNARCGLAALSCDEDAVVIDGSATVTTDSIATCGTASVPDENEGVVTQGVQGLEDIYADLTAPDNPTPQDYDCKSGGKGKAAAALLSAGTYTGGIVVKCTTVLNPGIYVIDGGTLDLTANYNVTGARVMFVLKNGATIKFGGNGNSNKVVLTPIQAADLPSAYADNADDYAGKLVFEDRASMPTQEHTINGNSNSLIEGLIYLPKGDLKVLGTANVAAQCLQITAYRIRIQGNASLETLCPPNETTSVGSSTAKVRLVV